VTDDFITGDEFDPNVAQRAEDAVYENKLSEDDAVQAHLRRCKEVYTRVFVGGNASKDDLDFLLRDLAFFARADQHFFPDTRLQDGYIGRKQVVQRIVEYTSLDFGTLVKRYIETQNG